jgi:peroxiredoxin (alkyl hydroperoxide reductase subunit C)
MRHPAPSHEVTKTADLAARRVEMQETCQVRVTAHVGKKAPDFEASVYVDGGFKNIRLSDYAGKWIVLCSPLYPNC